MIEKNINNKKVSIIIPVYNVERYIEDCLNSVVNQTLEDIEIICVNDCTPDNSFKIVKEFAQKDTRFVLIEQKYNQGQGIARNAALDIATGEYIMFLDPDDWLELDAVEEAYQQIVGNQNDMVIFAHNRFYEQKNKFTFNDDMIKPFEEHKSKPQIDLDETEEFFMTACYHTFAIYKKELLNLNNIRYPDYEIFEDQVLYIKALLASKNISVIDKPLYNYRINQKSTTFVCKNPHESLRKAKIDILQALNKANKTKNIKKNIYAHTIKSCLLWHNRYCSNKNFKKKEVFYNNIKEIFSMLDKNYIEKNIKALVKKKEYKQYEKISNYNYLQYKTYTFFKKVLKNVFSIKNSKDKSHKIIKILGFKISYNRTAPLINLIVWSHLTSWIFPTKEDRKEYKKLCKSIEERKSIAKAQKHYLRLIKKLKNKKEKIKVLFLVNDLAKWKAQSLYDLMTEDELFEPVMAITIADLQWRYSKEDRRKAIQDNIDYFKKRNMNYVVAYDIEKDLPIKLDKYKPNIIFYQQPWKLSSKQEPKSVYKYALPFYIPYFVNNYEVIPANYATMFHKYLFRHYVLNRDWEMEYQKKSGMSNIMGLGNTMLDNIYLNKNKTNKSDYIIYAPHWSFSHSKNPNIQNYGTFLTNRYEILEYAKSHPELKWVFKPHPRLKDALLDIGETKEQVNEYWNEWKKIGLVCEDSSYMDMFLESKALITDCGSFLTEYFCTGKPLIHLISGDCLIEPNRIAKKIFNTFYKVYNVEEALKTFDKILLTNFDDMKQIRLDRLRKSNLLNNYAAKNIIDDIKNLCSKEND